MQKQRERFLIRPACVQLLEGGFLEDGALKGVVGSLPLINEAAQLQTAPNGFDRRRLKVMDRLNVTKGRDGAIITSGDQARQQG